MNTFSPTPYPAINAILYDVLTAAQEILGDHFVGMYLEGSLVSDDFDQNSDIDFVVVTDEPVSSAQFAALQAMHDRIGASDAWYAIQLEGSYVPLEALRRHDPANVLHPNIERGRGERLKWAHHDTAWNVHRWILRDRGVTLAGPPPHTLIDPIAPHELQQAMVEPLQGWAAPMLAATTPIQSRGYQSYVVLTLCRMLYTMETGRVATKRVAARWAFDTLDARWRPLIEDAWEGRHNPDTEQAAEGAGWEPLVAGGVTRPHIIEVTPEAIAETQAFIRFALDRSQQIVDVRDGIA